jgi:hypothetical protein
MGKTYLAKHNKTGVICVLKQLDYMEDQDKKMAD